MFDVSTMILAHVEGVDLKKVTGALKTKRKGGLRAKGLGQQPDGTFHRNLGLFESGFKAAMWRDRASSLWLCVLLLVEAMGIQASLAGPAGMRFNETQARVLAYLGSEVVINELRVTSRDTEVGSMGSLSPAHATVRSLFFGPRLPRARARPGPAPGSRRVHTGVVSLPAAYSLAVHAVSPLSTHPHPHPHPP